MASKSKTLFISQLEIERCEENPTTEVEIRAVSTTWAIALGTPNIMGIQHQHVSTCCMTNLQDGCPICFTAHAFGNDIIWPVSSLSLYLHLGVEVAN